MPYTVDVSCIKTEQQQDELEAEKWNINNLSFIKEEQVGEIDIGPIKLEENVYNNIKTENQVWPLVEQTAKKVTKQTKSNNRRAVVRIFHQRIVNLDNAKNNSNSKYAKEQTPSVYSSNAEHMRELRERLMKLESPIKVSATKPAKSSAQLRRQLEQRLMQVDTVHRTKTKIKTQLKHIDKPQQMDIAPPKTSAQRMRELRQRRRDLQTAPLVINQSTDQSTNNRPATPPALSVKRMREFRQRLLNIDESLKAQRTRTAKAKTQFKQVKSNRRIVKREN